jgi:hypothetical protein
MRTLFLSLVASAGLALAASQATSQAANAAPASGLALSGAAHSDALTLVRDRCGRGRPFSKWRGVCVWNTPVRPRYYAPPPVYGYGYYRPPVYGYGYYGYGPGFYYGPRYGYYRW